MNNNPWSTLRAASPPHPRLDHGSSSAHGALSRLVRRAYAYSCAPVSQRTIIRVIWLGIIVTALISGAALTVLDILHHNDPISDYPIFAPGGAAGIGGTIIVRLPAANSLPDTPGI